MATASGPDLRTWRHSMRDDTRSPSRLPATASTRTESAAICPTDFQPQRPFPDPDRFGSRGDRPSCSIFLESFRGDLVGRRLRDRRSDARTESSSHAKERPRIATFAHTPLTWPSRAQLFQGRVARDRGRSHADRRFSRSRVPRGILLGQNDLPWGQRCPAWASSVPMRSMTRARIPASEPRGHALPVSLQVSADGVLSAFAPISPTRIRPEAALPVRQPRRQPLPVSPRRHRPAARGRPVIPLGDPPQNAQRVFDTYLQASRTSIARSARSSHCGANTPETHHSS